MTNLNSYFWVDNDKWLERAEKAHKEKSVRERLREKRKAKRKRQAEKKKKRAESENFLKSYDWRKLRYATLKRYGGRCMACGRSVKDGARLNVDHIKCRKQFPELALDPENLQVLCGDCNHGKGNWDSTDWRP